jgi:3-hydroxyacyl-[acyl-carrier-protein] dehydratase
MRFVLVDRIDELDPGKRIRASKTLATGEEIFRDHFPGFPVVPGVLLTEMMAQAGGRCLDAEDAGRGRAMLGQIKSASFREWVKPDEEAVISVEITLNRGPYALARGFVEVAGRRVASADLMFVFLPRTQCEAMPEDQVLAAYWKAHTRNAQTPL